jgi:hypothetical protein
MVTEERFDSSEITEQKSPVGSVRFEREPGEAALSQSETGVTGRPCGS